MNNMTYYDRLRNRHDRHLYESPEDKEERFRRLMENQEFLKQKDLYKCECRKEEGASGLMSLHGWINQSLTRRNKK